jgi:hypothetical protein
MLRVDGIEYGKLNRLEIIDQRKEEQLPVSK